MGLLDAVAGAVRGGAGAVGDIADSEIKTNQAMRLQQQHADLQGQLNSQLSDLNVAASQKIADYQQTVQGQIRQRRAGVLSGATSDDGSIDAAKGRNLMLASGDLEGSEGMDKLTGKWSVHGSPWGKQFKINDQTGETTELDNPGANHLTAQEIRTNGKGFSKLDQDAKNDMILQKAINGAMGPMPMISDPTSGEKRPSTRGLGVFDLAHAHAADTFGDESTSVQPSVNWARDADAKFWQKAQQSAPNDPQKQEQLYGGYIRAAISGQAWRAPTPRPAPPPSAGAAGQPQRDAAATAAQPSADSAAQSDTARMNSVAGLLSSARAPSAAPAQAAAPKVGGGQIEAQAEQETREIEAGKRTDYSPEVKAFMNAQGKARSDADEDYLHREQAAMIARSRALRGQ